MKAVISDTSPLSYLVRIGEIDILPAIFEEVMVPPSVLVELRHASAPAETRCWAESPPSWIHEQSPAMLLADLDLDLGETEAISLAKEHAGSLLIIDEVKGRGVATQQGIRIVGTLGMLEEADRRGLLDFEAAISKLRSTNFRVREAVIAQLIQRVRDRKV